MVFMKGNTKGVISFFIGIILLGLVISGKLPIVPKISTPTQTTQPPSPTFTITPPPPKGNAITLVETNCHDWMYQLVSIIAPVELVQVLGKNKDGSWFMVSSSELTTACWVKSNYVKPDNFVPSDLPIIDNFPPIIAATIISPSTPTPTSTVTPTPTVTRFYLPSSATRTQTLTDDDPPLSITPTFTFTNTPTRTATYTSTPTATNTSTPTDTPSPTPTTPPPPPPPPPCSVPSAPSLNGDRNGQNVNLSWSSVPGATSYEVSRSENGGAFISIGTTSGTSMKDSIPNSTTYEYVVVAINSCGKSNGSNRVSITR
jgi:hypothetical protein